MKKTLLVYVILYIVLVNIVYAGESEDFERIVVADGDNTRTEIQNVRHQVNEDLRVYGQEMLDEFFGRLNSEVKKFLIMITASILGIVMFVEGIVNYFRIKKEKELLILIKDDLNIIKNKLSKVRIE